jgi:hypothetical protein
MGAAEKDIQNTRQDETQPPTQFLVRAALACVPARLRLFRIEGIDTTKAKEFFS